MAMKGYGVPCIKCGKLTINKLNICKDCAYKICPEPGCGKRFNILYAINRKYCPKHTALRKKGG